MSTGPSRELTAADVGKTMRVEVTATNAGGSTNATSASDRAGRRRPAGQHHAAGHHRHDDRRRDPHRERGHVDAPDPDPHLPLAALLAGLRRRSTARPARTLLLTGADAGATVKAEVTHAGVSATSTATTAVARATYTHVLCANPATGVGVGADGVLPDGWSHVDTMPAITTSPALATRCSGPGAAGIPFSTSGTYTTSVVDDRLSLLYRTPATSTSSARSSTATAR